MVTLIHISLMITDVKHLFMGKSVKRQSGYPQKLTTWKWFPLKPGKGPRGPEPGRENKGTEKGRVCFSR